MKQCMQFLHRTKVCPGGAVCLTSGEAISVSMSVSVLVSMIVSMIVFATKRPI